MVAKGLNPQWIMDDNSYTISIADGSIQWSCLIPITTPSTGDQLDFETNYKATGNMLVGLSVVNQPPLGAKFVTISGIGHKLYARFTGLQFTVNNGSNTLTYTATYNWAKIVGIECVNCTTLDTVDLKVLDTAQGTYSGVPNAVLNQFSYTLNLPAGYYQRMAQFDADIYVGMVLQFTYVSNSLLAKTIGINLLMNEVK